MTRRNFSRVPWMKSKLCTKLTSWPNATRLSFRRKRRLKVNSTLARKAWIHPLNRWANRIGCNNNPCSRSRNNLLLLSKRKNNTRSKFKSLIIAIKTSSKLKSQRAFNQMRRSKGSKKTRKGSQIKSISYCRVTNNSKWVTRGYLTAKLQLVTILRSKRLMEHVLSNYKAKLRTSRKPIQT